jgi:hypothetical protein
VISEASVRLHQSWDREDRVCYTCYENPAAYSSGECLECEGKETENYARQWAKSHAQETLSSVFTVGVLAFEMDEDLELKHRKQEKYKERCKEIRERKKHDEDQPYHTQGTVYVAWDWDPELGWVIQQRIYKMDDEERIQVLISRCIANLPDTYERWPSCIYHTNDCGFVCRRRCGHGAPFSHFIGSLYKG